ncbi:hypothetical protein GGG16DRAFT_119131 [Schizophyllum commune]
MPFYLFFPPGASLPPIVVYHFEHNDTWVAIGGNYDDLLKSPRYERFQIPSLRKDRLGPQWILLPFIWRPYAATTIISDQDPVAPVLWKPDVMDLQFEEGACRRLREEGRPGQIIDRVHDFCIAAHDHISFVAWYTLSFPGFEDALSPPQLDIIKLCQFDKRPKRGCLLNLLVDYSIANFEAWIKHRVPVYYLFTEAMSYVDRFVRVRPDVLLDYRERAAAGASSEELIEYYRVHEPAVLAYDDFFQVRRPLAQQDLFDTPIPIYDSKTAYSIQVCQGYRPYTIHNPPLIKFLLPRYEVAARDGQFPRVDIARWAPRTASDEERGSDVFLMDHLMLVGPTRPAIPVNRLAS